jgi:hypothetical protein
LRGVAHLPRASNAAAKKLFHRSNVKTVESKTAIALILTELHGVMAHAGR